MDEVRDKFKGFMKKVNNQLSSSSTSGRFKGQSRVLGNEVSSSAPEPRKVPPTVNSPSVTRANIPKQNFIPSEQRNNINAEKGERSAAHGGFDPFDSLITSSKTSKNGYTLNVVECPICGEVFTTEEEASVHVNSCVSNDEKRDLGDHTDSQIGQDNELEACVSLFLSETPSEASIEIVLKLLRNVVSAPNNSKFRRIRMANPKIKEAIADVPGGIELLNFVGFMLKEEDGEMWAVMENPPTEQKVHQITTVAEFLEKYKIGNKQDEADDNAKTTIIVPQKIDRQIRVFFPVPEAVAAKFELSDSFYALSADEIKREADNRKKKIADSQLLIPKSMKEKQAKAARKKHPKTIIRIQFPDGVLLEGVFGSRESTTALYEFVSKALKNPGLEFDLLDPVLVKRRVIPLVSNLEDEGLVPSALIKFRLIGSDSSAFTGISDELLQVMEPIES